MKFREAVLLKNFTTFRIGGPAKYFKEITTLLELQEALRYCYEQQLNYMILGRGSNLLFDDRGFDGVILLNRMAPFSVDGEEVVVGAGYSFSLLGRRTASLGLSGLEFASGIPGSVGGAVYMNAGAYGAATADFLKEITYLDEQGELFSFPKDQLRWDYRSSSFQDRLGAIALVCFSLKKNPLAGTIRLEMMRDRYAKQPYTAASAGCIFRNPPNISAGALIDQCFLKGAAIGDAEVSSLHANFILNRGNATAEQVVFLIQKIQKIVYERTGIFLKNEIKIVPYQGLKRAGTSESITSIRDL